MEEKIKQKNRDIQKPHHYVAVGASAGGLEAIESFFSHMPPDSGMGFIVIQHLSPDYKSLMVDLLSKRTEMPVHRIEDGMEILANNIYLIPPKTSLTIFHGILLLNEPDETQIINLPIDIFLRSLAEDQGEKSIAVILSGSGSDGARGVRVIKEFGGMIMVQDPETAKFDGMPKTSIGTGLSDFILPPQSMPEKILSYIKQPIRMKSEHSETLVTQEEKLTRIYALLRERSKLDFTYYKPSTVFRRIERRMKINNIEDVGEYVYFLQNYSNEIDLLYRELLIGVTRFFRDIEVFDHIYEKVLPDIIDSPAKGTIRFWIAGCSTGEEAYSLAILICEYLEKLGIKKEIKIFATDVDKEALQFAAEGNYPESITADINPEYLEKYFIRKEDSFQITRKIREMVVFAQHNIIKDPPFTNISFISCRNLLIYLQSNLQQKVMDFFNFSLIPGGYLVLGTSETIGDMTDYFVTLHTKFKIYQSKGRIKQIAGGNLTKPAITDTRYRVLRDSAAGFRRSLTGMGIDPLIDRFLEILTDKFIPLTVITNNSLEVIQVIGDSEGILKVPSGRNMNDLSKMVISKLEIPISTGVSKALREKKEVQFNNIEIQNNSSGRIIDLRIIPFPVIKGHDTLAAVFISEREKEKKGNGDIKTFDLSKETEEHFREIELELQFTRENLQATIEELETSNEELQATNEELLASNEELQSTNEELQSTNEELFTVNAEHQSKIIELTELHNDIENLLETSEIGQILVDENMELRLFSKQATKIFHLLEGDIGRPITHISNELIDVDLVSLINQSNQTGVAIEQEVATRNKDRYIMKVIPYKIAKRTYSGTILTFFNITKIAITSKNLDVSIERFRKFFDTLVNGVVIQDKSGQIIKANPAAEKLLGLTQDQMLGRTSIDPRWKAIKEDGADFPGEEHPAMQSLKTGQIVKNVVMGVFNPKSDKTIWLNVTSVPNIMDVEEEAIEVFTSFEDITEIRKANQQLKTSKEHLQQLLAGMPFGYALHEMIYDVDGNPIDYRFLDFNKEFELITGLKRKKILNKTVKAILPGIEGHWMLTYDEVLKTGQKKQFENYNADLDKHFSVTAFKITENRFAVVFSEIRC